MPKAKSSSSNKKNSAATSTTSDKTTPIIKPLTKPRIKNFPCAPAFECTSGELLWGQLQQIITGNNETEHDSCSGPVSTGTGGTIIQSKFRYRAAARKGKWIVERFAGDGGDGYVVHHEDVSGKELLSRCCSVGISNAQGHKDSEIVYVNRYDWSFHSSNQEEVEREVNKFITPKKKKKKSDDSEDDFECDDNEDLDGIEEMLSARLIMLDASEYQPFMKLVASGKHPELGVDCQLKSSTGSVCGVHLSDSGTEYELGWMIFSGEKHKEFTQDDELVGFVYDSSYCGLDGEYTIA